MYLAVMRAEKIKTIGMLANRLRHATRELPPDNADPALAGSNELLLGSKTADGVLGVFREKWPEKRRKDAVLCVEYLMSASREWWLSATKQQQSDFVKKSHEWLANKYGSENVLFSTLHRDEATPHLSVFVVPLKDGKLQAKNFIGNRSTMSQDQTTYADKLRPLGIQRGVERSTAEHVRPSEFYARLQAAEKLGAVELEQYALQLNLPSASAKDLINIQKYALKVAKAAAEPLLKMVRAQHQKIALMQQRIDDLTNTSKETQRRFGAFFEPLATLASPFNKQRALSAINRIAADAEKERIAELNAILQSEQEFNALIHKAAHNMCAADPTLSETDALDQSQDLLGTGDPKFEYWLEWKPEPKIHHAEQVKIETVSSKLPDDDYSLFR